MKLKNLNNRQLARLLRSVAAALTVKDENKYKFPIIAYERAADSIEHSSSEIKDLWDEDKLSELAGVGSSITAHLNELFKKGRVKHFEEIFSGLPQAMFELLDLQGIGPKTAFKLAKTLKLKNPQTAVKDLKLAVNKQKVRSIPGFGGESELKIAKSLEEYSSKSQRIVLPVANQIAQELVEYLKQNPEVIRADPLGSLRRKCSTVGDIDIAVSSQKPKSVIKHFIDYPQKKRLLESGSTTSSLLLKTGYQVDLMIQPASAYGALLQHFTGSKHHNIKLRELALKNGYSLSEYGMRKTKKGTRLEKGGEKNLEPRGKLIKFASEEAFYHKLGLSWIPPELREDTGEIEAASKNKLPKLVEVSDIKGDPHLHSNFPIEPSHDLGENPMEEHLKKAKALGYQYLAFTEHNPSLSQHTPEQFINLVKKKKELIEQLNSSWVKKMSIKAYNSLEVDIRPDGRLAIPEKAFDYLDFIIVSIHSSFDLNKKIMTERVLKAFSHPKAKILGHPTGRILNQREGYELDWERIFEFCKQNKKYLEINAFPDRLDLPDFLVKEAVKYGVKMVIATDSHQVSQMDLMPYGVYVARRGWAGKKDILNTLSVSQIDDILLK